MDDEIGDWAPGQFARIHVGNDAWRDYSIAGVDGHQVRFLISTRTRGQGSRFEAISNALPPLPNLWPKTRKS